MSQGFFSEPYFKPKSSGFFRSRKLQSCARLIKINLTKGENSYAWLLFCSFAIWQYRHILCSIGVKKFEIFDVYGAYGNFLSCQMAKDQKSYQA